MMMMEPGDGRLVGYSIGSYGLRTHPFATTPIYHFPGLFRILFPSLPTSPLFEWHLECYADPVHTTSQIRIFFILIFLLS